MNETRESGADFLAGGGEMGERIRAFDWTSTPLGRPETWPQSLKTIVRVILDARYPMFVWWGASYTNIYNNGYAPILGKRHPRALGRPARDVWSEIWEIVGPQADAVMRDGRPNWHEESLLLMERNAFLEETYFTYSYSPVPDGCGGLGGILGVCTEETQRVIGRRRLRTLRALAESAVQSKTAEGACAAAAITLEQNPKDLPFAMLYLLDEANHRAVLAGVSGVMRDTPCSPTSIALDDSRAAWPFRRVIETGAAAELHDLIARFGQLPGGAWHASPQRAIVLPMRKPGHEQLAGFVVAAISPRLAFDDEYRGFVDLLAGHVATAVANARAYAEERERADALAEIDRAKTAFFSNVSHEFRTPLTLMLGPVEELLSGRWSELSPAATEQLELVNRNGLRLLRLVNTLLDFSRIEAGRVRASYQPTDLAAFTLELASVFRSAIERAGMRLVVDCPPLAEPVYVDRDMWEKICLNLLSNAFKFTFAGEIAVALRKSGSNVELSVRDTGTGIPAEEMPRLFERFHRVENARGRTHEGSGIGLALVHELVKLHRGSIAAHSVVDEGTTFTIALPLGSDHLPPDQIGTARATASTSAGSRPYVEEALRWLPDGSRDDELAAEMPSDYELVPVPAPRAEPDADRERPCVLVADDNADMRGYVVRLLAERYRIVAVADGAAALAAARAEAPDLVLTDVMMPRLDGFGLLRELRAHPRTREIPVILLSARAGEESRVEGLSAGADDYLIKPFSARELQARVAAHLEMARVRREAADSLRASETRFKEAQRVAHVGSWQWNASTDECIGSDELCRIFGWPVGTTIPSFAEQDGVFYPHDEWLRLDAAIEESLRSGTGYVLELQGLRNGERFWLVTRSEVVRDDAGAIAGLRGTVQDITDRKLLELERQGVLEREREARTAAERLTRLKDDFLATLSHELRNPLNAVIGWVQILKIDASDPEKVLAAAEIIHRNARVQARLISDLLDLSRIAAGKVTLDVQPVEPSTVVDSAIESMRPAADAKNIRIESDVRPVRGFVLANVERLQQVMWNLLSNAVKFTPDGGLIEVSLECVDARVEIRVRDSGEGIAPEFLPYIFERFRQANASASRPHGGLGIGLALVKQLVELHGGSVRASSAGKSQGSTFVVDLPLATPRADRDDVPRVHAAQLPIRLHGVRVLVVDDEEDAVTMLRLILEESGVEVRTALSTDEALARLEIETFDLVISDIGMPGRDGYELVREMRARGNPTPAVALTAFARSEDRDKALHSGYQAHVSKPIETIELLATVGSLVETRVRDLSGT